MAIGLGGSLVKGMIGGALKERAKNIGKTKAGKLLAREGRVMTGKPQPKGDVSVQPQQTLAPAAPTASSGGGGGGKSKFATEKEAALSIKTTTIQVATLLKGSYVLEKEQLKNRRKGKEKQKRKSREGLLEKAKGMVSGFKMPKMPGKGLLDSVFGFVGQLVFGMVMMKLVDFLPTIQKILPTLGRIVDWVIDAGIWVVDTLANFIDLGYKLVDGLEGMVRNIFGEEGAETFKTFMTNIKDLIQAFLIWKWVGKKIVTALVKNIKLAWSIAKGLVTNAFKIVNFLTGGRAQKGLTAVTKGLSKAGSWIGRKTGLTAAKKMGGSLFKHGAKRAGKRVLLKMMGKTFVKAAGKIFGRIPIVGPLVVGLVSLVAGEPIGKALFKAFGAGLGGFLGGIAGGALSTALATLSLGIGAVLIPIVTPAAMIIGELIGTFVGDMLYGLIFGGGLSGVVTAFTKTFTGIWQKIAEGLQWLVELPLVSQLIKIVQDPGSALINFARWIFFDAIPWVMGQFALAAKIVKEWFDAGVKRFVDNFPVFDLPKMKFGIPGVPWPKLDVNWLLGKAFGGIPWFQQWINGEEQLMHFPDFSMFIPGLGLPFLIGHIGKSLFPNSWFKSWPSGVSGGVNAITSALGVTGDKEKDDKAKDDAKTKVEKEVLKKKNELEKSIVTKDSEIAAEKDPKKKETLIKEKDALQSKITVLQGESGDSSVVSDTVSTSTVETKLKTANEQGGAKAVIESISTTASYDKNETEVVTVPAPKTTVVEDISGAGGGGNAPLVVGGGGEGGADPYESLYKGG